MFYDALPPFTYTELFYNKPNPVESRIKLQLDNGTIIDLQVKIEGTSIFGEPPPTAIWNPETKEIVNAEWLTYRLTPGFQRFTFFDMCKLSYDTQNKNVNYFVYEAYLAYLQWTE
jgi:hypothetical protein